MLVFGKERKFRLTVGAAIEIANLCPDKDLRKIGELLEKPFSEATDTIVKMIAAMSAGHESYMQYMDPGYAPTPLTEQEIMILHAKQLAELRKEALAAFSKDAVHDLDLDTSKKKEPEKA